MKKILLSADGDISLYETTDEVMNNIEDLIIEFHNKKNIKVYDETLFVQFITDKFGRGSIKFVKVVGMCAAGQFNEKLDIFDDLIEEEYKNIYRINF